MRNTAYEHIIAKLQSAERILLLTHMDPDPDAIGTTQAMAYMLRAEGKQVQVYYALKHPKLTPPTNAWSETYPVETAPEIDLARWDYTLVLDTSYSRRHILGLRLVGDPPHGVGTLDHHVRSDDVHYPDQDHTEVNRSSCSELVFELIERIWGPFEQLPSPLRETVAGYLTSGMVDDMVGLRIVEKANPHNLHLLRRLKAILGEQAFLERVNQTRTLTIPTELSAYADYLNHRVMPDAVGEPWHIYLARIRPPLTAQFKQDYPQLIMLYEHYARVGCLRQGWNYGMFILLLEELEPGITKLSARGPVVKAIFSEIIAEDRWLISGGISGESAFGGKMHTDQPGKLGQSFEQMLRERIKTKQLEAPDASALQALQAEIDELIGVREGLD